MAAVLAVLVLALLIVANLVLIEMRRAAALRQSVNDTAQEQVMAVLAADWSAYRRMLASDGDLAEIWALGLRSGDDLEALGRIRFEGVLDELLSLAARQWHHRDVDPDAWSRLLPVLLHLLTRSRVNGWWSAERGRFPAAFVAALDDGIPTLAVEASSSAEAGEETGG